MDTSLFILLLLAGFPKEPRETFALSNYPPSGIFHQIGNSRMSSNKNFTVDSKRGAGGSDMSQAGLNKTPTPLKNQEKSALVDCLYGLTRKYFGGSKLVVIVTDNPGNDVISSVLYFLQTTLYSAIEVLAFPWDKRSLHRYISYSPVQTGNKRKHKFAHILIFLSKARRFGLIMSDIVKDPLWSNLVPMIVAILDAPSLVSIKTVDSIAQETWKHWVVNAVFVLNAENASASVYTVRPYMGGEVCGQNFGGAVFVGNWKEGRPYHEDVFPPRKLRNLHGCPLEVVTLHYPPSVILTYADGEISRVGGVEGNLVTTIAAAMNFLPVFRLPRRGLFHGVRMQNGSFNGIIGDLAVGEGDLAMGGFLATPERYAVVDGGITHSTECFTWAVPVHDKQFGLKTFLDSIASPLAWSTILAMMFTSCLASWLLSRWSPPNPFSRRKRGFGRCCIEMISGFVGVSLIRPPPSPAIKVLFPIVCISGLVASTAIQSQLVGVLTAPASPTWPRNVKELIWSNIKVGGNDALRQFIQNLDIPSISLLVDKYIAMENDEYFLAKGDWAVPGAKENLRYRLAGRENFRVQSNCMLSFQRVVFFRKRTPLIKEFDRITFGVNEGGLIKKWLCSTGIKLHGQIEVLHRDKGRTVLTVRHLYFAFAVLIGGLAIGSTVLILEFCASYSKIQKHLPCFGVNLFSLYKNGKCFSKNKIPK